MPLTLRERSARAKGSLVGLSVGDAFGDQFFLLDNRDVSAETGTPPAPWTWSDDTEMACSMADALNQNGHINQDELIRAFADRRAGNRITAQDTVPFALWAAATRLDDYESAVRACAAVGGDMDTTAAMAGGIIAAHHGTEAVPEAWLEAGHVEVLSGAHPYRPRGGASGGQEECGPVPAYRRTGLRGHARCGRGERALDRPFGRCDHQRGPGEGPRG